MTRRKSGCSVVMIVVALGTCGPAWGYLKIHPSNPHYLQETSTGEAVLIATVTAIVPADLSYDYITGFRVDNQAHRVMYSRVWHFTPWAMNDAIWPWATSATGGGYWGGLGGNKLDMNSFNTTYWTRMNDAMNRANGAGVYAEIMLFDRVGLSPAANDRWGNNPWAANNNINSLEVPNAQPPSDGTPEFYGWSSRPNLKNQQERYVRKMIDETIAYPNCFYEVENEHWQSNSAGWADHYGQFVKDYITANYSASPRLVSYNSIESEADNDQSYTMSAIDIVNKHYGNEPEGVPGVINDYIEARWGFNKPINIDEFANGVTDPTMLRNMCWETVTSGGHFHIEDAAPSADPFGVVETIRSFKASANWNFVGAAPNQGLITSGLGFCLAKVGEEYVCYFLSGGNKTVNLAAATYRSEWWNPRNGGYSGVTNFTHGGGGRVFTPPDGNDWVLHVTTRAVLTTVLNSKPAGTITIDGNSSDWTLSDFVTNLNGGDTGTGDKAVIGFGGYENWTCYQGNHATGQQFPPADAADHAVKVYSRHDANYLYFLVRLDDSDRQTSNPVGSNWANDCVEFYIDPGNDGGSTTMSNSTSDVQLVIDAANQKNVYMTTSGYATQVLAGVTSAVTTDAAGWWLEVRISKTALDPDIPSNSGTIGVDFNFRDNDSNNNPALTTVYAWHENCNEGFPGKIPDHWGDLNLNTLPSGPPGQASNPSPANAATGVDINADLSWTSGSGATSHNVRFGTANPPPFIQNQAGTTYDPGTLSPNTTYFWRIDEQNGSGTTTGVVWSFTTLPVPGVASNPNPASGATNVTTNPTLTWTAGSNATSHDVRFGTANPPPFVVNQAGTSYAPGALSGNTTYFWRIDEKNGSGTTTGTVWSFTTTAAVSVPTLNVKVAGTITVDGSSSDWNLAEFVTKVRGGEIVAGDYGIVGFDGGIIYRGQYAGVLPTSAADHTAKIYSRHDATYQYFLLRLDDSNIQTQNPVGSNWANDCVEFYIDPSNNGGSTTMSNSTSDIQLVIDAANQRNVYMCTSGYTTQVLNGVTSAVTTDGTGWWLEVRITKSALDPDMPASGTFGVDFNFRDNDNNNDPALTTVYTWAETSTAGFPSKIPDHWGDGVLATLPPPSPPGQASTPSPVSGATGVALTPTLSWTAGSGATSHDVRFGTANPPPFIQNQAGTTYSPATLATSTTYFWRIDEVNSAGTTTGVVWSFTTTNQSVTVPTLNVKVAGAITVDGNSSDWNLSEFVTKVRGGEIVSGDYGIVGFDGGTLYYAGYYTPWVLPTSAADHTAKIYSRHNSTYQYFLLRIDDSNIQTPNPVGTNWANDCVEFYIDPSNDGGSTAMNNSTSDIQLVIDAANQRNVYVTTSGYATQVLNGVTSAVTTDGTGWWLEVRITKSALDPDMPASGTFGVDFAFRDNDSNGSPTLSTMYAWSDNTSGSGFPTKIPNKWGDAVMAVLPPPGQASSPNPASGATGVSTAPTLSWTAGLDATSHDVRFGTANPPPFVVNQTAASYSPGALASTTTYYWRIDEKNGSGTTTGVVWSFTTAAGVSWQVQYDGSVLPTVASPAWDFVGNANFGSVTSGVLRDNDTSTSQYIVYWRGWNASNATGITVETRMQCDTITAANDQYDIDIYDGTKRVGFLLYPNQLKCQTTGALYSLTGNQYHVYRFTLLGNTWNAYLDGNTTPIMTGAPVNTSLNEMDFGTTSFVGKQSVYFDYLYYTAAGAFAP